MFCNNVLLHFKERISENFWNLYFWYGQFFSRKVSPNFQKNVRFLQLFQNRKKFFVPKLVQNHYIDQSLAKFTHKTTKTAIFTLKMLCFRSFRLGAENLKFDTLKPDFFVLRIPLRPWPHQIYLWFELYWRNLLRQNVKKNFKYGISFLARAVYYHIFLLRTRLPFRK